MTSLATFEGPAVSRTL